GVGNQDGGDTDAPEVCYDAMSSFNVTVSLQPKTPSSPTGGANSIGATQSLGSGSLGRTSFGSTSSTVVSKTPSLAESIGNFDPDKFDKIAKQALAGSGLLSGDMSAAFPESIERAEQVLRHTREVLARADGPAADSLGSHGDGDGRGRLTTEELEQLSRALKRTLFVCPNHKGLHALRGEVHRRLQDFRTAVGSLRLAVRMDKTALNVRQRLAEVLLSQGMVWIDGGDDEAALACFEEACTVDGANACAHFCKTIALVKLAKFGDALRAMEAVLGRRRGTADDFVLRAKIRWALGMVGPGNDDMDTARALQSDHPEVLMFRRRCLGDAEALYAKAKALADAGDDAAAVKVLNQVAEFTPDDVKVPIVRAACKRRLKDFVGALEDYDECAFRHFQGVHVGRRALHEAVNQIRNIRGEATEKRRGGGGGGSRGGAGVEFSFSSRRESSPVVAAGGDDGDDREDDGGARRGGSDNDGGGGNEEDAKEEKEEKEVAAAAAAGVGGGGGGTGNEAGRGGGVAVRVETAVSSSGPSLPERWVTACVGVDDSSFRGNKQNVVTACMYNTERRAEAELRWRFRLAIPHAGLDPTYALRLAPSRCSAQQRQHEQQEKQQQEQKQQQQQRVPREQAPFSLPLSPPPSMSQGGATGDGNGGLLRSASRGRGGGRDEEPGEEKQQQQQQGGEGYTEPPYITRQRCLVLNDWALSLFEVGEYAKAVLALDLAIAGDQVFAKATGGKMESKFFLNRQELTVALVEQGDCCRGSGAAEMAVRDYKRALEVEPGNWMVSTRLSLAHYLKGNRLFNSGDFLGAKSEVDTAIAFNWKVPAYYILRGHAQYFGGWISDAHSDYRKALQLDPENLEAQRLCRQFDSKGKRDWWSGGGGESDKKTEEEEEYHLPAAASRSTSVVERSRNKLNPSPPWSLPASSDSSVSSSSSWLTITAPSRPSPQRPPPLGLPTASTSGRSMMTTTATSTTTCSAASFASSSASSARVATTTTASGTTRKGPACRCEQCGAVGGDLQSSEPRTTRGEFWSAERDVTGGAIIPRGGHRSSWKRKQHRSVRRRRGAGPLPKVDSRVPKQPEWGEKAIFWVKAGDDGVKRVFKERFGGVPARNERLWGMLRPAPKKSWSAAGTAAG
ncbi:unnamed protein product, partial [Pylaiella littoralis]